MEPSAASRQAAEQRGHVVRPAHLVRLVGGSSIVGNLVAAVHWLVEPHARLPQPRPSASVAPAQQGATLTSGFRGGLKLPV